MLYLKRRNKCYLIDRTNLNKKTMTKSNDNNLSLLTSYLSSKNYKLNEPLAKYTTVGIGGPADILFTATTKEDLINTIIKARGLEIPITILGGGSNVLISDKGIRGLTIRMQMNDIQIENARTEKTSEKETKKFVARWEADSKTGTLQYEFADLDYDESDKKRISVTLSAGTNLQYAIRYLIEQGMTGLQWYSYIPGTIGGAVYNNLHGGTHFIGEVIEEVEVLTPNNKVKKLTAQELKNDYDKSRFHDSKEIILSAKFKLFKGDTKKATYVVNEWASRKAKQQPMNSTGCIFINITQEQKEKLGYPTTSAGYIIEHPLKMTGFRIGDAMIATTHHNFIVNMGKATAKDYLAVIKEIQKRSKKEVGIELIPEIVMLGEF